MGTSRGNSSNGTRRKSSSNSSGTTRKKANSKSVSSRNSTSKNTGNTSRRTSRNNSYSTFSNLVTVDDSIRDEAILLAILAVCILLYLALFNVLGSFGEAISHFLYGIFGLTSFAIPVIVFLSSAFFISNKGQGVAYVKVIAASLLVFILASLAQLMFDKDFAPVKISEYYTHSATTKRGGGLLGGFVSHVLNGSIGRIGAFVVLIVMLIICIVLITEKSFFGGVKRGSESLYYQARDNQERVRENRRIRQIERQERLEQLQREREESEQNKKRRSENVVSGVMLDTELRPNITDSDDMHEIKMDVSEEDYKKLEKTAVSNDEIIDYKHDDLDDIKISSINVRKNHNIEFNDDYQDDFDDKVSENYGINPDKQQLEDDYTSEVEPDEKHEPVVRNVNTMDPYVVSTNEFVEIKHQEYGDVAQKKAHNINIVEEDYTDSKKSTISDDLNISTMNNPNPNIEIDKIDPSNDIKPDSVKSEKAVVNKSSGKYKFPPVDLLKAGKKNDNMESSEELKETAAKLKTVLETFNVRVTMTDIAQGPTVTRYEMLPELGTKVSKITGLADDIKLNLAAQDVRIEAPIPGKSAVGIEIPNKVNATVMFRDLIEHKNFKESSSKISFAVGKDLSGDTIVADIAKMPHMLIAGSTGSGKSVCINTLIMSIIYKARPDEVKLIMVDPKVVELSVYNGIPHLMIPVVTDPKKAAAALNWGVAEMTDRYNKFAEFGVRDLKGYNKKIEQLTVQDESERPNKLPQIVIIVDELADLMMVASKEVEESICRLAQLARAAGIHLIIATQRPSVDVITGLIKANMPSRIAFAVSSGTDSRTILDSNGAEKLLGKGDMLFYPQGYPKPTRLQGAFISDDEIADIVDFLKSQNNGEVTYNEDVLNKVNASASGQNGSSHSGSDDSSFSDKDDLFIKAAQLVIDQDKASIGFFQRKFKIGFNRAARIMDQLAEAGVVGEEEGTKPRKVLMSMEQFENALEQGEI